MIKTFREKKQFKKKALESLVGLTKVARFFGA
jgi:hypothetical protein